MKGAIERRAQQFRHAGVDDGEVGVAGPRFEVDDARQEHARGCRDRAPRFEDDRQARRPYLVEQRGHVLAEIGHLAAIVRDAEATAKIHVLEAGAGVLQLATEARGRAAARRRLDGALRTDVHVNGDELERSPAADRPEQPAHIVERHPEFVDLETGRDMRVAFRVDVGIHAHGDARRASQP
jgi:hypothetical protein